MLVKTPTPFRPAPRRGRKAPPSLILTAAVYTPTGPYVRLTFDRAVNIAAIDVTAITVDDGVTNHVGYRGTGTATLVTPQTVQVNLAMALMNSQPQVLLVGSAATRIAAGDGGLWAGVTNLVLPF